MGLKVVNFFVCLESKEICEVLKVLLKIILMLIFLVFFWNVSKY